MKISDLLDMTLGEVLQEYCILYNLECCYNYGITSSSNADRMYDEFNVEEDYPEAMTVLSVVDDDLLLDMDVELVDWDKIVRIMKNLDISKKDKTNNKGDD